MIPLIIGSAVGLALVLWSLSKSRGRSGASPQSSRDKISTALNQISIATSESPVPLVQSGEERECESTTTVAPAISTATLPQVNQRKAAHLGVTIGDVPEPVVADFPEPVGPRSLSDEKRPPHATPISDSAIVHEPITTDVEDSVDGVPTIAAVESEVDPTSKPNRQVPVEEMVRLGDGIVQVVDRSLEKPLEVLSAVGDVSELLQSEGTPVAGLDESMDGATAVESPVETNGPARRLEYKGVGPAKPQRKPDADIAPEKSRSRTVTRKTESELHLRINMSFHRLGAVQTFFLLPDRRDQMPEEIEVEGTQGRFSLSPFTDGCFQGVSLPDIGVALREGVKWLGVAAPHKKWVWVLGGRPVYVLAPGPLVAEIGGFVSVARLLLNEKHVVLSSTESLPDVLEALTAAGCEPPEVMSDPVLGVPAGWTILKGVVPRRPVPMRAERDVLNALCPRTDIEPLFEGGIRLERQIWLAEHPPGIRFSGEIKGDFMPTIDGRAAVATQQGYVAEGWDGDGSHQLLYADQATNYALRPCEENWKEWLAYDFKTGASICGAVVRPSESVEERQVRVPSENCVLIGAEPGQIHYCRRPSELKAQSLLARPSFEPVWALPSNPAHLDKRIAKVIAIGELQPVRAMNLRGINRQNRNRIAAWCSAISDAGRKGLRVEGKGDGAVDYWRQYRKEAKRLRKATS
jgi:hypothetical protein